MKYSYYLGCQVPTRLSYCDLAVRSVTRALGIELLDLEDAGCCGYPIRFISSEANLVLSARILALAEREGLDLMVLCNSCYSSLLKAKHLLDEDATFAKRVERLLSTAGLHYSGNIEVKDILEVFYFEYGIENLRSLVQRELKGLKVAVHYGCHLLRPSKLLKFDNAENPKILDELVEITSADSIYWPLKLWCCGCPTLPIDQKLALGLARKKIEDAIDAGAHCIVTTCPSCQISFDIMQPVIERIFNEGYHLPVLYYPQLLGLAMGMNQKALGLTLNRVSTKMLVQSVIEKKDIENCYGKRYRRV
jgi:heterodisulfide reductase subunit B